MAGQIKKLLDHIIDTRAQGNPMIAQATKTKLILKGISPNLYNEDSDDDESVLAHIRTVAEELEVAL